MPIYVFDYFYTYLPVPNPVIFLIISSLFFSSPTLTHWQLYKSIRFSAYFMSIYNFVYFYPYLPVPYPVIFLIISFSLTQTIVNILVCFFAYLCIYLSMYLSIYRSIYQWINLSIYVSIVVSINLCPLPISFFHLQLVYVLPYYCEFML